MFEEHGDIKTFFDLIANRGMVFVTFVGPQPCFDAHGKNSIRFYSLIFELLRGPENVYKGQRSAVDRYIIFLLSDAHCLLSSQIDVHYSLPRDDSKGQDRDRNQVK